MTREEFAKIVIENQKDLWWPGWHLAVALEPHLYEDCDVLGWLHVWSQIPESGYNPEKQRVMSLTWLVTRAHFFVMERRGLKAGSFASVEIEATPLRQLRQVLTRSFADGYELWLDFAGPVLGAQKRDSRFILRYETISEGPEESSFLRALSLAWR